MTTTVEIDIRAEAVSNPVVDSKVVALIEVASGEVSVEVPTEVASEVAVADSEAAIDITHTTMMCPKSLASIPKK